MRRRAGAAALIAAASACALAPAGASAHGLVGKEDLPVPSYLFAWGAAAVLVISFVALAVLWPEARMQEARERRLVAMPPALTHGAEVLLGLLGVAIFGILVYAGVAGEQDKATANLAPTAIYVIFWVGLPALQLVLGDLFAAVNPWRAVARAAGWALRRAGREPGHRPYPERLGRWPAVATVLGFAILELAIDPTIKDDPSTLAWIAVGYAVLQLAGYALYGVEQWGRYGDGFATYFGLFARLSPWRWRREGLFVRPPLSGVVDWEPVAGSVALLCVMIGSTSFDGFSTGPIWAKAGPDLTDGFQSLGAGQALAAQLGSVVGLLLMVALISAFYFIGISGMPRMRSAAVNKALAGRFVHTLVPIALAYLAAHYFSLLVFQGQAMGYLISDPLGNGSDLFGTANATIDYSAVGATTVSYVQVAALVAGHAAGLVLAHDRALTMYSDARAAARSQYWMLAVMVGFTSLGLYLLFAANR